MIIDQFSSVHSLGYTQANILQDRSPCGLGLVIICELGGLRVANDENANVRARIHSISQGLNLRSRPPRVFWFGVSNFSKIPAFLDTPEYRTTSESLRSSKYRKGGCATQYNLIEAFVLLAIQCPHCRPPLARSLAFSQILRNGALKPTSAPLR